MKKLWLLSAGLVALSGSMFADNIWSGSSNGGSTNPVSGFTCAGCTAVPTTASWATAAFPVTSNANTQTPFWNNPSTDVLADGNKSNVGDVLAGLATGTSPTPANVTSGNINGYYYSQTPLGAVGDPITGTTGSITGLTINGVAASTNTDAVPTLEFSFQSTATAYTISLLFADSGLDTGCSSACGAGNNLGTTFGSYTEPTPGSFVLTPITTPMDNTGAPSTIATGDNVGGASGNVYGFYATVCYQTNAAGNACVASVTYTTGAGNWSTNPSGNSDLGGLGWNHFALFELANGQEVLGFEDSPWTPGSSPNGGEGIGDFNDIIIGLTGNAPLNVASTPEPGTIAIMGLGLAGLGLLGRRRFAKK
jgi:hypothetical protein